MKRYLIQTAVKNAQGWQVWYVDADTPEDALEKYQKGDGDLYASEVEVTSVGEPELEGETTLDDFGDFAEAPQRTWIGLTDEDRKEYVSQDFGGNRLDAMDWAEKRLKERNT